MQDRTLIVACAKIEGQLFPSIYPLLDKENCDKLKEAHMENTLALAVELGDISLGSATSSNQLIWVGGALLVLIGLTIISLWWRRHNQPDPFVD